MTLLLFNEGTAGQQLLAGFTINLHSHDQIVNVLCRL